VVYGDRTRLVELVQNLLENAARFMGDEPSPRVHISCRPGDDGPVLFVEDNGVGVDPRFHERIFGLFERNAIEWGGKLDPTKTVRISYLRARRMLLYRIADPGQGFTFEGLSHSALANPTESPAAHMLVREEKGLRPGGFGLLMAMQRVDELVYNQAHNEVVLIKYLD
jgi:anti-sigma regulatory factor (Ser/Thr protein kinase)